MNAYAGGFGNAVDRAEILSDLANARRYAQAGQRFEAISTYQMTLHHTAIADQPDLLSEAKGNLGTLLLLEAQESGSPQHLPEAIRLLGKAKALRRSLRNPSIAYELNLALAHCCAFAFTGDPASRYVAQLAANDALLTSAGELEDWKQFVLAYIRALQQS